MSDRKRRKRGEETSEAAQKVASVQSEIADKAQQTLESRLPAFILELDDLVAKLATDDTLPVVPSAKELADNDAARRRAGVKASEAADKDADAADAAKEAASSTSTGTSSSSSNKAADSEVSRLTVPEDAGLADILQAALTKVREGTEMIGIIKTWIQLNIPRIEDGNNFGVAVQEECVNELNQLEGKCFAIIETSSEQLGRRATLAHKMTKHALIHDYREAILQNDLFQRTSVKMRLIRMRNGFMVVHDLLTKNRERLLKPRQTDMNFIY